MKNKQSDNRKAFPKFIILLAIVTILGFFIGLLSGNVSTTSLPEFIAQSLSELILAMTPGSFWVVTALLGIAELRLYNQAKQQYSQWDQEDEDVISTVENKLAWVLLLANANMIIDFFFFGLIHILISQNNNSFLIALSGFILSQILIVLTQQKVVDLEKKINPEKQGSVYDLNFKKKWMASCDENEQRLIGQCAMKSYSITTGFCIGLWVVLLMVSAVYPIGILPIFIVTAIMAVSSLTYCYESIRLEKH